MAVTEADVGKRVRYDGRNGVSELHQVWVGREGMLRKFTADASATATCRVMWDGDDALSTHFANRLSPVTREAQEPTT